MSDITAQEWSDRFNEVTNEPPKEGDILATLDGEPVKLIVELNVGAPPFIYGRCYVPDTVGAEIKWVLQSADIESFHGWKCILMPRARADLIKKVGLTDDTVMVQSLRVIRLSQSQKSLLCEVAEYCSEEETVEEETE